MWSMKAQIQHMKEDLRPPPKRITLRLKLPNIPLRTISPSQDRDGRIPLTGGLYRNQTHEVEGGMVSGRRGVGRNRELLLGRHKASVMQGGQVQGSAVQHRAHASRTGSRTSCAKRVELGLRVFLQ